MAIDRQPDPKGDRVWMTLSGKFLPYKYHGAGPNEQAMGYREETEA